MNSWYLTQDREEFQQAVSELGDNSAELSKSLLKPTFTIFLKPPSSGKFIYKILDSILGN